MATPKSNKTPTPTPESSALAKLEPSAIEAYGALGGQGFEDQTSEDMSMPFIGLLQALSPQVNPEGGLEDARPGMLINTVSEELYDGKTGILIIPVMTKHTYVEWVPRDKGGGFVGLHDIDSDVVAKAKADSTKFGKYRVGDNDLVETFYVYAAQVGADGELSMVAIDFSSTKISVYKRWMSKLRSFTVQVGERKVPVPMFAHLCRLKSVSEKNNKGTYYNYAVEPANGTLPASLLAPEDARFQYAHGLYQMIRTGQAKVNYESQRKADGAGGDGDAPF